MRFVTWNCNGGPLAKKLPAVAELRPDILVLQECPENGLWFGDNRRRGIAVIARPGIILTPLTPPVQLPRYVIPIQVSGSREFLLLAVWAMGDKGDKYVRGLTRALGLCSAMISAQPTVILGDYNSNTFWDGKYPKDLNHTAMVGNLGGLGLISAYHEHLGVAHGAEPDPTFFLYRHEHRPYHLDYCFIPKEWAIESASVGAYSEWCRLSDHMPLTVDVQLGKGSQP